MGNSLVVLRIIGFCLGIFFFVSSFVRYRSQKSIRSEFIAVSFLGFGMIIISLYPGSINVLTGMLAFDDKQFGRLIALLVLSNMAIWWLLVRLQSKNTEKSIQIDLLIRHLISKQFISEEGLENIKEITVIIPVLNEAENLKELLSNFPDTFKRRPLGILVVDDGSIDDTVSVVREAGCVAVSNPFNRGGGSALRLGYDIAIAGGAEIIITMDGDGQHRPMDIENLLKPILSDTADFVIGSRILGEREKDSVVRWFGIHFFNRVINLISGTRITDCSNGFRAFRVESLKKILFLQDQFHTAELIIEAAKKGIRIDEAPVTVLKRFSGISKKGKNFSYGLNFAKTVFKTWLRK